MSQTVTLRPPINPIQPGVYDTVNSSAVQGQGNTLPVLVVMGGCFGGPPNTLLQFTDPAQLQALLRSGPAYDCARFAMAAGVVPLSVVRVGSGILQSTLALLNGGGQTVVTLTSRDYGSWTTGIKITVTATNIITLTYTAPNGVTYSESWPLGATFNNQTVTAALIANAINGQVAGLNGSQYVTAAAGAGAPALATLSATPLAGGSDGDTSSLVSGDWTTALQAIEAENVDIIVPATGAATVHAQVLAHCDNMSQPLARHERVCELGGVLGESVATVAARPAALGSDARFQLVYPGMQDFDDQGNLKTWDPFYHAAKTAAMHVTQPDAATPIIHQQVPVVDLEQPSGRYLSTLPGSDVDQLLRANVTPVVPAPQGLGGFIVVDSLSGWSTDQSFRDFHKIRSLDAIAKRLRTTLEAANVGKKSLVGSISGLLEQAKAALDELVTEGLLYGYLPPQAGPGASAASINLNVPIALVEAQKYIPLQLALQPAAAISAGQPTS